jgi:hypothetical protein
MRGPWGEIFWTGGKRRERREKGSPPYTPLDFSLLFLAFDWLSLSPPVAVARQNGKFWEISAIAIM